MLKAPSKDSNGVVPYRLLRYMVSVYICIERERKERERESESM